MLDALKSGVSMANHEVAKRGRKGSAAVMFTLAANALRDKSVSVANLGCDGLYYTHMKHVRDS